MIDVVVHDRIVVVLGRRPVDVDPAVHVARAARRRTPLLMLALGYPVSRHQQAFITRAIDEALEARVHLDAQIVVRPDELAAHVGATDDVTIVAAGRDERRIGSVLARLPS
ncbi:MAG: hypothetical protein ACXVEI_09170 [Actinomycetota bacterium]